MAAKTHQFVLHNVFSIIFTRYHGVNNINISSIPIFIIVILCLYLNLYDKYDVNFKKKFQIKVLRVQGYYRFTDAGGIDVNGFEIPPTFHVMCQYFFYFFLL